jgi:hypothetical protein
MTNVKMTKIQTMNSINITHGKLKTEQAFNLIQDIGGTVFTYLLQTG